MKKLTHNKIEGLVVILITVIILLLMFIGVKDSEVSRAKHLTECTKKCYPSEVDVEVSRYSCYCSRKEE